MGLPEIWEYAAPRALTVVVVVAAPKVPAVVELVGVVAVAVAASSVAVEDTWAAAGTRGAGTCTGRTHRGGSRSSKHRIRICLHRLVLVPRLMLVPRLILIPILLRPLLLACLRNM